MPRALPLCAAAAIAVLPGLARADARADLQSAFQKVTSDGSFQTRVQIAGQPEAMLMSVILPDRFRMKNPEAEVIITPAGTWTHAGGQWMKLPVDMSQVFEGFNQSAIQNGAASIADVRELPSETVDGCAAKVYAFRSSGKFMGADASSEAQIAVCQETGLPLRVISGRGSKSEVTVHYDFSSEFSIEAPQ